MYAARMLPSVLLLPFIACSGGSARFDKTRSEQIDTSQSLLQTGSVSTPVQFSVEPGKETHLAVQAVPAATCVLHGNDPSTILVLYADDDGVVRFDASSQQPGALQVSLDCQGADGAPVTYALALTFTSDPGAVAATSAAVQSLLQPTGGVLRAPLTGD